MNKSIRDLVNQRGDTRSHISKIIYYGAVQSIIFNALQSAMWAAMGEDDEELLDKKKSRLVNGIIDGWLVGMGYQGRAISTVKNTTLEFLKQRDKGYRSDHAYTLLQALSFSPPISAKARKIYGATQTDKFNAELIKKRGFSIDNPAFSAIASVIEGAFNIPLNRLVIKMNNIDNAMDNNHEWWQRVALILGWNKWDLGIKDPDLERVKKEIKKDKEKKKSKDKDKDKDKDNSLIRKKKKKNSGGTWKKPKHSL
jgi:hypothetical protein